VALLDSLVELGQTGAFNIEAEGREVADSSAMKTFLASEMERTLNKLAQLALLIA
jgi:hypothetical protein